MNSTAQKSILWVLLTLAIAALPQALAMPPHLAVVVVVPIAWRWLAAWRHWKPPGSWLRIGITLLCVALLIATYGSLLGRRAAVSLLTLMLALKLLETFRVRDARIVTSLSLFLCATQFLFSQGISMVLYTAATIISGLVALALLQRREAFRPVGDAPETGHSLFAELGFTLRLLALAAPAALAVFLLFPRWSSPLWGVPEEALDARSGLSDSMSPGSIQSLFMDDSPAFRADFDTVLPSRSDLYWRGPVFWNFDGREWSSSFYSRRLRAENRPRPQDARWRYRVQLEPHERRWLFALDYPAMVPSGSRLSFDYQLISRRPVTSLVSYEMASDPGFTDSATLRTTFRRAALNLPPDFNPRTREMMQAWRRETPDDAQLIQRTLAYFNREGFEYTLNPPLLSRHTIDEFLFETRSGFCEHYASAFTVMMRMAGIPARVVTGYQGGWNNEMGGYVLVRQSDAHAWSEVWLRDRGWTRVDPTGAVAPERIQSGSLDAFAGRRYALDFEWVRGFRNGFDVLQRRWNDWVIAFNADRQSRLFMPFGMGPLEHTHLIALMLVLGGLASLLTLPALLRLRIGQKGDPVVRSWNRFRRRLRKAGINVYPGQTPSELAAVSGGRLNDRAGEIDRITEMYIRIRYGDAEPLTAEFLRAAKSFRPERAS